jgi:hypothetical protein
MNVPLSTILDSPAHDEISAGADHVLIVRRDWRNDHLPNFILGALERIAGVALMVGRSDQGAWIDATANVDELTKQVMWIDPVPTT